MVGAQFIEAHTYVEHGDNSNAGFVSPSGGKSGAGSPMEFIYTAPNRKLKEPGFSVGAASRAGMAIGEWHTGLGTGWSGQVSCSVMHTGDAGGSESGSWSNFDVAQYTVTVKDGVASGSGFHQIKNIRISKRPVANYADPRHPTWADDGSSSMEGTASEESKGKVMVNMDNARKTYSVTLEIPSPQPTGKLHSSTCIPNHGCMESDQPFGAGGCFQGIGGNFSDPNQLHGATHDEKTGLGTAHTGTYTYDMKWDLARQGTTQK